MFSPIIVDWSDMDRLRKLLKKAKSEVSPEISAAGLRGGAELVKKKVQSALNKPGKLSIKDLREMEHPYSKKRYKNSSIQGRVSGDPWYGVYKRKGNLFDNVIIEYDNSSNSRTATILMDPEKGGSGDGKYPTNKKGISVVLAGTSRMKGRNVFALAIREKGTIDHVRSVMAVEGLKAWNKWIRKNVSIHKGK